MRSLRHVAGRSTSGSANVLADDEVESISASFFFFFAQCDAVTRLRGSAARRGQPNDCPCDRSRRAAHVLEFASIENPTGSPGPCKQESSCSCPEPSTEVPNATWIFTSEYPRETVITEAVCTVLTRLSQGNAIQTSGHAHSSVRPETAASGMPARPTEVCGVIPAADDSSAAMLIF